MLDYVLMEITSSQQAINSSNSLQLRGICCVSPVRKSLKQRELPGMVKGIMDGVKGIFYNRRYPKLFLRNTVIGRSGRDFLVPGDSGAVVVDEVGEAPYNHATAIGHGNGR